MRVNSLDSTQIGMLRQWFAGLTSKNGGARYNSWLEQIGKHALGFADFSNRSIFIRFV